MALQGSHTHLSSPHVTSVAKPADTLTAAHCENGPSTTRGPVSAASHAGAAARCRLVPEMLGRLRHCRQLALVFPHHSAHPMRLFTLPFLTTPLFYQPHKGSRPRKVNVPSCIHLFLCLLTIRTRLAPPAQSSYILVPFPRTCTTPLFGHHHQRPAAAQPWSAFRLSCQKMRPSWVTSYSGKRGRTFAFCAAPKATSPSVRTFRRQLWTVQAAAGRTRTAQRWSAQVHADGRRWSGGSTGRPDMSSFASSQQPPPPGPTPSLHHNTHQISTTPWHVAREEAAQTFLGASSAPACRATSGPHPF
jgi:hypothetical protein